MWLLVATYSPSVFPWPISASVFGLSNTRPLSTILCYNISFTNLQVWQVILAHHRVHFWEFLYSFNCLTCKEFASLTFLFVVLSLSFSLHSLPYAAYIRCSRYQNGSWYLSCNPFTLKFQLCKVSILLLKADLTVPGVFRNGILSIRNLYALRRTQQRSLYGCQHYLLEEANHKRY